ncbi:hypothetical protein L484_013276 [Morus notabilis]|uniref:Uncharacterized protein n=1 Tax=Morus notabilis TaxID=981085 RepID=W9S497_9ROSA|nr:hypothetical protein L484_013276 [Morus notabilis]
MGRTARLTVKSVEEMALFKEVAVGEPFLLRRWRSSWRSWRWQMSLFCFFYDHGGDLVLLQRRVTLIKI